jgi:hypothetical protein
MNFSSQSEKPHPAPIRTTGGLRNRFLFNIYTDPDDPLLWKPIRRVVHKAIRQVFSETEEFVPSPRCRSPFFSAIEFSVRTGLRIRRRECGTSGIRRRTVADCRWGDRRSHRQRYLQSQSCAGGNLPRACASSPTRWNCLRR